MVTYTVCIQKCLPESSGDSNWYVRHEVHPSRHHHITLASSDLTYTYTIEQESSQQGDSTGKVVRFDSAPSTGFAEPVPVPIYTSTPNVY
jgi:hypothetical protein